MTSRASRFTPRRANSARTAESTPGRRSSRFWGRVGQDQQHEVLRAKSQTAAELAPRCASARRRGEGGGVDPVAGHAHRHRQACPDQLGLHGPRAGDEQGRIPGLELGQAIGPAGALVVDGQDERNSLRSDQGGLLGVEEVSMDQVGREGPRDPSHHLGAGGTIERPGREVDRPLRRGKRLPCRPTKGHEQA